MDGQANASTERGPDQFASYVFLVVGCVVALLMAHYPMIFSLLRRMQTGDGDPRFNNYLLEHSFLWLERSAQHRSLWNPPMFSPESNVLAYSDVMLSFAPLYWIWRAVGIAPDTSFQLWMLETCVLNYVLAVVFLRGCFGVSRPAAAFGAVLFAGASSRVTQLGHQQLYFQAYVLLACIALSRLFTATPAAVKPPGSIWNRGGFWIGVLALSATLQLWGGFYFGYFLLLSCGIATIWALCIPPYRRRLVYVLKHYRIAIVCSLIGAGLLTMPLIVHYLRALKTCGPRPFDEVVRPLLPVPQSWIYMGPCNLLYGWMNHVALFGVMNYSLEHGIGLGAVTMIAAAAGLWAGRRRPFVVLAVLTMLTLALASTLFFGRYTLWHLVYQVVPGAKAIRGVVRLGLLSVLPASIGLALFVDLWKKKWRYLGFAVATLCLFEQITIAPSYDKFAVRDRVDRLAARIPPRSDRFFYYSTNSVSGLIAQLDGMWASLATGIPTINGYTGSWPPDYGLDNPLVATPSDRRRLYLHLLKWINEWHLDMNKVAWVGDTDSQPPISLFYDPAWNPFPGDDDILDHPHDLPLLKVKSMAEIAADPHGRLLGHFDTLVKQNDIAEGAYGWALLPDRLVAPDTIVLSYRNPAGDEVPFCLIENNHWPRPSAVQVVGTGRALNCGWQRSIRIDWVPKDSSQITAWAYDSSSEKAYKIDGTLTLQR